MLEQIQRYIIKNTLFPILINLSPIIPVQHNEPNIWPHLNNPELKILSKRKGDKNVYCTAESNYAMTILRICKSLLKISPEAAESSPNPETQPIMV